MDRRWHVLIPVLSAFRAHRYMAVCGIFVTLLVAVAGCGSAERVTLAVGAEGFEPPVLAVPAGKAFELEIRNDTRTVQTITVAQRPPLRVLPQSTGERELSLPAGDHRVTLEDAPFQAT